MVGALTAAAAAAAIVAAAPAVAAAAPAPPPRVFAFVSGLGGTELERVRAVGHRIDVLAPNWFAIDVASGRVTGGGPWHRPFRRAARARNAEVWPVVNARTGGSLVIRSRAWQARVARQVARIARNGRYPGMTIDVEELEPNQERAFTAFVRRVARRLDRRGRRLAVYVPRPFTSYGAAYDWEALARAADLVLAAGYNEHASGTEPGPVATPGGFAAVLEHAAAVSRRRIVPTIGAFGYRWPVSGGAGELLSTTRARRLRARCGTAVARADGSISFRCGQEVVVYESGKGLVARARAARRAGFRWLGLFSLGREPRRLWRAIATARRGAPRSSEGR